MSTQLKLLANYGVTGFLLSTGLFALIAPTTFAAGFGMPIPADTFASGFVQCVGGRNLTFGIIAGIFLQRGDVKAVALMATMLAVDGFVDGMVTMKYAGVGYALPHFGAAAVIPFGGKVTQEQYVKCKLYLTKRAPPFPLGTILYGVNKRQ